MRNPLESNPSIRVDLACSFIELAWDWGNREALMQKQRKTDPMTPLALRFFLREKTILKGLAPLFKDKLCRNLTVIEL